MPTACEGHLPACCLANAAAGLHHRDREASSLAEWVADRKHRVARGRRMLEIHGAPGSAGRSEKAGPAS